GHHWIVALAIGSENNVEVVQVYDSIFCCADDDTAKVINNLFNVNTNTQIKVMTMHGSVDCGVFVIAVCTSLLHGLDVSLVYFSQNEMRQHLFCFTAK
uniref:Ubiquitin-like protease family profile domain-containing protein n=1 Tax=Amphimedon queenslandica TaxID=400682 RepID=A0A1X7UA31_AMPQE